jgi:hypothetical protein
MKLDDRNKIYFKLWRFLEFEVSGKDAIRAGKPYMFFGAAFIALFLVPLYLAQSFGFERLISLLAR